MSTPPVSYLSVPGGHLGWQSWGESDELTILDVGVGFFASIEDVPDQPRFLRWVTGLAAMGRLLRFDPPGVGTSDAGTEPPSMASWADAAVSVLDAAGVERAVVLAAGASSGTALRLLERHPTRAASLVLVNGAARAFRSDDYPEGMDPEALEAMVVSATAPGTTLESADVDLLLHAPTGARDPEFRTWWGRVARRNARPQIAGPINAEIATVDLRGVLAGIDVPTLVIAHRDIPVGTGMARRTAEGIKGARYVELPGVDVIPFVGDGDAVLAEIREHLTGDRFASTPDRVLAAVLFTDLVGSTSEVVSRGDGPWRALLLDHGEMVRSEVARYGGRLVQDLGDGTLCTFPAPGAAIRCALALVRRSELQLGVPMRAGLHAGEIEVRGSDVAGINVHVAARVAALANAHEVLVSTTVIDLVAGSPFVFDDRGVHELKGVPGTRQVWAAGEP